ncbi:MAG: hypothetical protein ACXABY_06050 [Candidatus Thorarchaeota archaeon]
MDFETLVNKLHRKKAEFEYELARCHDVCRLAHLVNLHVKELELIRADADELVRELERGR